MKRDQVAFDEFEELEAAEARERARPPRIWQPRKPAERLYWWSGMTGTEILASAQVTLTAEDGE